MRIGTPSFTMALPLSQGGTGSAVQVFVDQATAQAIGGTKTFDSAIAIGKNTAPRGLLDIKSINTIGTDTPQLRFENANTKTTFVSFDGGASNIDGYLDVNIIPGTAAANCFLRLFRYTNTSGTSSLILYKGDGSTTSTVQLSSSGASWLGVSTGNIGIGTITPGTKMQIFGGFSVTSTATAAADPGSGNIRASGGITAGTMLTGSAIKLNTRSITANISVSLTGDHTIVADATAGSITVTLPTAVGNTGVMFKIKKMDATANAVVIATTASQTIDGATTKSISSQYTTLTVQAHGSNWIIV